MVNKINIQKNMDTETNSVKKRMKHFLSYIGISEGSFESMCGLGNGWVSNIGDSIRTSTQNKILNIYPDLNIVWLLTGEGSMLKSDKFNDELVTKSGISYKELGNGKFRMTVPFVPQKAYAKYLDEVRDAEEMTYDTWDFIVDKIGHGDYRAFEIKGDSMDDDSKRSICNGDVVLARDLGREHWVSPLNIKDFPYWIIAYDNTVLCKQIVSHDVENGTITCHSLNDSPEYNTDFELKLDSVYKLYNIIQRVTIMM